jgi:hypothetical protein
MNPFVVELTTLAVKDLVKKAREANREKNRKRPGG